MKKSLFLLALPLMLGLCSCNSTQASAKIFVEDNLAHEEIFGKAKVAGQLNPVRNNAAGDLLKPKIGVQYIKSDENNDKNTTISIRFVAAIASLDVTAVWNRTLTHQDDYVVKEKEDKESKKAYAELNNNGSVTKASDLGAGYNYFVVYTLLDIPFAEYQWSYLAASLTLTDSESNQVKSDVVAVNVAQDHYFSFGQNEHNGYFLEGTINGEPNEQLDINDVPNNDDKAREEGIDLQAGDSFGVFYWTESEFRFLGKFNRGYETFYTNNSSTLASNYAKVLANGKYNLNINDEDRYGLEANSVFVDIYFEPGVWNTDSPYYCLHTNDDDKFYKLSFDSSSNLYKINLNIGAHNSFLFTRMNSSYDVPVWNSESEKDHVYNQTPDVWYYYDTHAAGNVNVLSNKFSITGWNDGNEGKSGFSRSVYSA